MPTILIVAASPLDQDRLRLGAEVRDIRHALQRSRNRENWTIESNEAATVDDLRRALLDFQPTVVHFAGHSAGPGGLCFENPDGYSHTTNAKALSRLFHHFKNNLKCVVLNACYSDEQGDVIRQEIDYVIGMRTAVEDEAAMKFSVAFYDAVFAGTDFRTAFDLGCTALDLNKLPNANVPVFMTSPHLGDRSLSYTSNIPEVERVLYAYLNTPFVDRCQFTTSGDSILPSVRQHYGEQMHRTIDKVQVQNMNAINTEQWRVEVKISSNGRDNIMLFYVRIRNRTVLVEWEATVGLWSIPVKTYIALGSPEPVVARVKAELDDYYSFDFLNQQHRFQSISLYAKAYGTLQGYVMRNTTVYEQIMAILSDGNSHSLTLEIINSTKKNDMPLIRKVLSPTWLYSPPKDIA